MFNAYVLKYPVKAAGWDIDEENNAPEGESLREHSLSGNEV